jgi:hypothetical protein
VESPATVLRGFLLTIENPEAKGEIFIELNVGGCDLELVTTAENGLRILDAGDPYHPSLLGQVSFLGWVEGVHVAGDYDYVANTWTGVRCIDIRDPTRPALVDTWNALQ